MKKLKFLSFLKLFLINFMLIGIEGFLGDGKTVYMVRCLKIDYNNGRKIFANFKLHKIKYTYFDINEFLMNTDYDSLRNATIGIDEITTMMDCRLSVSKSNIAFGYLVLQSRKRNLDIYYTTQDIGLVDYKRLIKYTQIFVICNRVYIKKQLDNDKYELVEVEDYRNYTVVDERMRKENVVSYNIDITKYYDDYDTEEIIRPPVMFKNQELRIRVKKLENILNENGIKYDK